MMDLKGVILAAGEGRRCRPLTQTRSKVMLPVGNRPFMEHVILALAANGVRDLYVVVGYQKERVMDYFEDGVDFGVKITYIEQNELLGTAHALLKAEPYVDEEFLVVNGDNLFDTRAIKELISAKGENVILAALRQNTGEYGVLKVEKQRVKAIIEKPGRPCAGILNTGAYKFSPTIFEVLSRTPISERGSYELTDTISQMIADGKEIVPLISKGIWADAVFAWDLLNANSLALGMNDYEDFWRNRRRCQDHRFCGDWRREHYPLRILLGWPGLYRQGLQYRSQCYNSAIYLGWRLGKDWLTF